MRTFLKATVLATALSLPAAHFTSALAQPAPVERTVVNRGAAAPAPSETPKVSEPANAKQFEALVLVTARAIKNASDIGTLGALAFASLCIVYLLMYLGKTALRGHLPEHYKKLLRPMLGMLTIAAAGLGYYLGDVPLAGAAGLGALLSAPSHDILDAIRSFKKK